MAVIPSERVQIWVCLHVPIFRKILAPIKIKSAPPPPPKKNSKYPPPQKNEEFYEQSFSCRKNAFFQAPIELAQPFPAPELRAENFTDPRIFLIIRNQEKGVFRRGFLQSVHLSWLWRSGCQMHCWGQYPSYFLLPWPWHWTLQKPPLLKPPFLGSWDKWLVLPRCEATRVFDLICVIAPCSNGAVRIRVGFSSLTTDHANGPEETSWCRGQN